MCPPCRCGPMRPPCRCRRDVGRYGFAWLNQPRDCATDGDDRAGLRGDAGEHAVAGRFNFDDRFVGLKLHHWLALSHRRTGCNHQAHQVTLMNVFAEFGQFEFSHSEQSPLAGFQSSAQTRSLVTGN